MLLLLLLPLLLFLLLLPLLSLSEEGTGDGDGAGADRVDEIVGKHQVDAGVHVHLESEVVAIAVDEAMPDTFWKGVRQLRQLRQLQVVAIAIDNAMPDTLWKEFVSQLRQLRQSPPSCLQEKVPWCL